MSERRRAERIAVEVPARLFLDGGVTMDVVIRNIGELGMLLSMTDLEESIEEGQRALLEHPKFLDGKAQKGLVRTPAAVVRVELDMEPGAIVRHVALYFDGGPRPVGVP